MADKTQINRRRPPRNTRANGVATRRRILSTATSMFAATGYEATSLRQISGAAKVDIATLKYHFGDKATLFAGVYQHGHEDFLKRLSPLLKEMAEMQTTTQVRDFIHHLVHMTHSTIEEQNDFVRMVLYRILEDSSDITHLEDELQGIALSMLEGAFQHLVDKKLIRPIDLRALITLLVSSIPMWYITAQVKPGWIGPPLPFDEGGRERSEAFYRDLLERLLLPSP